MYVYIYLSISLSLYIYIYIYDMCIYIYIYIYIMYITMHDKEDASSRTDNFRSRIRRATRRIDLRGRSPPCYRMSCFLQDLGFVFDIC